MDDDIYKIMGRQRQTCLDGTKCMMISRASKPTKHDTFPRGTVCAVINYGKIQETYIQCSDDEENPQWEIK